MARVSVGDKVGAWFQAYEAIKGELTPRSTRAILALMDSNADADMLSAATKVAGIVAANDRTAAIVAAMLVSSGVSRPIIEEMEGLE